MRPSDALRKYRSEIRDIVARHGALAPRVFGSAAYGTDTEESDLDLLVDPTPRTTLMTLAAIQLDAEQLLGAEHVNGFETRETKYLTDRGQ
ncbi:MAG: nucleotidyltransferase family protein [Gammaproteobacteria bacterium]